MQSSSSVLSYREQHAISRAIQSGNVQEVRGLFLVGENGKVFSVTDSLEKRYCPELQRLGGITYELKCTEKCTETPLSLACGEGQCEILEVFLKEVGATQEQLNYPLYGNRTALSIACARGHEAIVAMLLEHGACVSAMNSMAFVEAYEHSHPKIKSLLLAYGVETRVMKGWKLLKACKAGRRGAVRRWLLVDGADVHFPLGNDTALKVAIQNGKTDIVHVLIDEFGANVNEIQRRGDEACGSTALMTAIHTGNRAVIDALLCAGADVNATDEHGYTALMLASYLRQQGTLRSLIARGANVNAATKYGVTALWCAWRGYYGRRDPRNNVIELLLTNSANANLTTNWGETVLMSVCKFGRADLRLGIIKCLLAFGADPNIVHNSDRTALSYILKGYCNRTWEREIALYLLSNGAKDHGGSISVIFKFIVHEQYFSLIQQLYDIGVTPDPNALALAIRSNDMRMIRALLAAEADPNACIEDGLPLFLLACRVSNVGVLETLIDAGCDAMASDGRGETAVMKAIQQGCQRILRTVIDAGANVLAADSKGNTALIYAASHKKGRGVEFLQFLLDVGVPVNGSSNNGKTALYQACRHTALNRQKIRFLLQRGADLRIRPANCPSILQLVIRQGDWQMALLLLPDFDLWDIIEAAADSDCAMTQSYQLVSYLAGRGF